MIVQHLASSQSQRMSVQILSYNLACIGFPKRKNGGSLIIALSALKECRCLVSSAPLGCYELSTATRRQSESVRAYAI